MTDRLDEIRKRAEAATQWKVDGQSLLSVAEESDGLAVPCCGRFLENGECCGYHPPVLLPPADGEVLVCGVPTDVAEFIGGALEDIPWLIAEVERLRAENAELEAFREGAEAMGHDMNLARG